MDVETNLTFNLFQLVFIWLFVWYLYSRSKRKKVAGEQPQEIENCDMPSITMVGNDDYSLIGLSYDGVRIPDIEIKSKALYIDGTFKRMLARNSRLYNRGHGIFVDGKYVG